MLIKTLCLSATLTLVSLHPLHAQESAPKETPLFVTPAIQGSLDDRLFPIGWAATGKFAWICQQSNEAADDCNWVLTIQDMATNKIVEKKEFSMPDKPANGIREFWAAHGKSVTPLLERHAVKRTGSVMDHTPLVLGNHRSSVFQLSLNTVRATLENSEFGGIKSFQVSLSTGDNTQTLLQKTYERFVPFAVGIAGCFVSPGETRAAVVVTVCWRGYEGAPHPRKVEAIVGFNTGLE